MPEWRFRRMQPGEMNVDPIEAEFFSTASLDSLTDALVREALQNSLDARLGSEPVRVRIVFPPALDAPQRWFSGLWEHLEASRSGVAEVPDRAAPLPFVLVEDFGTRGLQGAAEQSEDEALDAPGARNDFYYFWRNIGRSRKGEAELGRWGLGKTVFPAASQANAFLALTVRADDRRALLMGQSVLRIHKLAGNRFYPYGYFGTFADEFALPVDEPALLDRFRADFAAQRNGEPGLSVVVPWPDPEITPDGVLASVLRHYFVPILGNDLVVEVVDGDAVRRLDAAGLDDSVAGGVRGLSPGECAGLSRLVALTRFGQGLARDELVRLDEPPVDNAPRWTQDCLARAPAALRAQFEGGRPIALCVPVWVKPLGRAPVLSEFDVYLQRDESLARGEEHFVREGITVAGVRGGVPGGVRAVVIARDRPLATLLGDSENPAHTEWQERSPKFKDRYRHGPFTLRYVRNAPREIARALTRPAAGRQERLLQHLFSLELPTEAAVQDATRAGEDTAAQGRSGASEVRDASATPPSLQIHKTAGGFRLAGGSDGPLPGHVVIKVAYEVRRGDPFSRYQRPDFDLARAPIAISAQGLQIERADGNVLVLRVLQAPFGLEVEGFDRHRDIRVRIAAEDTGR